MRVVEERVGEQQGEQKSEVRTNESWKQTNKQTKIRKTRRGGGRCKESESVKNKKSALWVVGGEEGFPNANSRCIIQAKWNKWLNRAYSSHSFWVLLSKSASLHVCILKSGTQIPGSLFFSCTSTILNRVAMSQKHVPLDRSSTVPLQGHLLYNDPRTRCAASVPVKT